ncbi:hypothetical protein B2J93_9233 [Marssonina coronariae]|uniref:DHHA2 domain-containing protein n=1 Tax=Diplocarpon coronariae TaxID=2795749 RepID=A0A218ZFS5_9HELO|nr:hypothetical protein B2J93_9233 [Marssonina coronariae]
MPRPRVSLASFLASAKSALHHANQQSSTLTFVVGNEAAGKSMRACESAVANESADLDSLCSAVVLAYLRTYASSSPAETLYIPLSNVPHTDLALRPELLPVLSRANLKLSDLITLSELPSLSQASSRLAPERTRWLLVDHNALLGELGRFYGPRVIGCIDHHDDEEKVPGDCGDEPRVIKKSGSCSSLVVEYCRGAWDAMSARSSGAETTTRWDAELARLALGPVLIDTSNLESDAKTTYTDVEAMRYLKRFVVAQEGAEFKASDYYEEIWTAERDVDGLSLTDLLRKDYKQWTENGVNLGVCSVVKNMEFLLQKADRQDEFFNTLKDFSRDRDLSICCVMTRASTKDGRFERELFAWGLDEKGVEAVQKFEAQSTEKLGLETWKNGSLDFKGDRQWRKCWVQHQVEHSRKQVAPLLRSSMAS